MSSNRIWVATITGPRMEATYHGLKYSSHGVAISAREVSHGVHTARPKPDARKRVSRCSHAGESAASTVSGRPAARKKGAM